MAETIGMTTKFLREGATAGTYDTIAEVASIQPPEVKVDSIEVDLLDPTDGVKSKLPGLIDIGDVTVTLNFDPNDTGHQALLDDAYARATKNYRIKLPNRQGWTFQAFISGWKPGEIKAGDVITADVTFTVTAKPTFGTITP